MESTITAAVSAIAAIIAAILSAVVTNKLNSKRINDKELFFFWRMVFDRPAFKGPHNIHSYQEEFKQAIKTVIRAVNTGVLLNRKDKELGKVKGKSFIKNPKWRSTMDDVEKRLKRIEMIIPKALPADPGISETIDSERDAIIKSLNEIWRSLAIPELPIPSEEKDYDDVFHE